MADSLTEQLKAVKAQLQKFRECLESNDSNSSVEQKLQKYSYKQTNSPHRSKPTHSPKIYHSKKANINDVENIYSMNFSQNKNGQREYYNSSKLDRKSQLDTEKRKFDEEYSNIESPKRIHKKTHSKKDHNYVPAYVTFQNHKKTTSIYSKPLSNQESDDLSKKYVLNDDSDDEIEKNTSFQHSEDKKHQNSNKNKHSHHKHHKHHHHHHSNHRKYISTSSSNEEYPNKTSKKYSIISSSSDDVSPVIKYTNKHMSSSSSDSLDDFLKKFNVPTKGIQPSITTRAILYGILGSSDSSDDDSNSISRSKVSSDSDSSLTSFDISVQPIIKPKISPKKLKSKFSSQPKVKPTEKAKEIVVDSIFSSSSSDSGEKIKQMMKTAIEIQSESQPSSPAQKSPRIINNTSSEAHEELFTDEEVSPVRSRIQNNSPKKRGLYFPIDSSTSDEEILDTKKTINKGKKITHDVSDQVKQNKDIIQAEPEQKDIKAQQVPSDQDSATETHISIDEEILKHSDLSIETDLQNKEEQNNNDKSTNEGENENEEDLMISNLLKSIELNEEEDPEDSIDDSFPDIEELKKKYA